MILNQLTHVISANYFRTNAFHRTFMKILRTFLASFISLICAHESYSQACTDALTNTLCSDQPSEEDTLTNAPLSYSCFSAIQTYYYTFHTNNLPPGAGSVEIEVNNYDCDDILGNDSIQILIVEIPSANDPTTDPCNPAQYQNPVCFGDSAGNFGFQMNALLPEHDYLVIAGSNHDDLNYGPCTFDVTISGTAVGINAGIVDGNILISLGQTAELSVSGVDSTAVVNWSPPQFLDDPTNTSPEATPEETTSFQVTATVGECELTDVVTLTVSDPVEIYNTFTPNSDGINDEWKIKYIERFPNCQVEIFDRWGQSIFKSVGYAQAWDGTFKGKYLPTAAYYYVIELNSLEVTIPPITGVVSIVH
jgi:gliding motility-associated-like protein